MKSSDKNFHRCMKETLLLFGLDGEANGQRDHSLKVDWATVWYSTETLSSEAEQKERLLFYNTNFPTPYSWVWCCLGSLTSQSPHHKEEPHRYLVILRVENQGLLSSISFFLVLLLLSKPLDAKPKSWLHPVFPSEETVLVIENRNRFFYSKLWDAGKIPVCAPPWLCLY